MQNKNSENAALMLMSKGIQKGFKGIQLVIEAGPNGKRVVVKGWKKAPPVTKVGTKIIVYVFHQNFLHIWTKKPPPTQSEIRYVAH